MRVAKFKVVGQFTGGGPKPGTVTIDRSEYPLFTVRPHKLRKTYELPLSKVAEFVVYHVIKRELADKKAAKKAAKKFKKSIPR